MPDESSPGLAADLKQHKATWIGVGIAALSLLVAFLIYRRNQSQQTAATSVFPVQGQGATNPTGQDLPSLLGNLIGMISAQNAQTQQEIAALTTQQANQTAATAGAPATGIQGGCVGVDAMAGHPGGIRCPTPTGPWGVPGVAPSGARVFPWPGGAEHPMVTTGRGGPEGVAPHFIGVPNGFVQHEFAPTAQVAALRGTVRQPYAHV